MTGEKTQVNNNPAQRGGGRGERGGGRQPHGAGGAPRGRGPRTGGPRRGGRPGSFEKPEFDQKIIDTKRVTRVVSGGRRFNFKIVIVAGDRNGRVGVGTGKAGDTALAIEKALRSAKKNMMNISRTKDGSISHEVSAKYSSARVLIMPAPGRGLIAGSSLRVVLDLAGVRNVVAKVISPSKNALNIARAAIDALATISPKKKSEQRASAPEEVRVV